MHGAKSASPPPRPQVLVTGHKVLLLALLAVACASAPPPRAGDPGAPSAPGADCQTLWRQYQTELGASAENCFSDEGCVAYDSCHAVTRGRAPTLNALLAKVGQVCTQIPGSHVEVQCAPRPPRCVARRCVRF